MKQVAPLLAIFLLALRLSAQTNATTRVALVSDSGDREVANVLDLATVKLGRAIAIELVERAAIARVLTEQHLSFSGGVDPNSVVSAGKLLAVDLFAVIDSVTQPNSATGKDSRTVAGLVVFDAKTGARLGDETLAAAGIENLADAVVAGVLAAQLKQTAAGLPTICLMSVRNADLPRSLDRLCDSVGLLLERRLTASPACVVLERERLDQVNQERSLPTSAQQQPLLASLVLMELECGRGPDGKGMSANARLTDNNGKLLNTFSASSQKANAAELAAALNQKISEAMQLKPGQAQEDRSQEADRFRQEAGFFLAHGDWEPGLQNLEAALALKPEDDGVRKQLAGTLFAYTGTQTNLLDALRIADRGMDLFLDCARASYRKLKPKSSRSAYNFTHDFDGWNKYLRTFNADTFRQANYLSAAEIEEARELLHSLYKNHCSFRRDIALPALFQAVLNHPDDRQLDEDFGYVMFAGMASTENLSALFPEDFSKDWLAAWKTYLDLLEQAPLEKHPCRICEAKFMLNTQVLWPSTWREVAPADREEAWRLMAAHSCVLVRALGKLDEIVERRTPRSYDGSCDGMSWYVGGKPYRIYLQNCLADPILNTNFSARRLVYEATGKQGFDYLGGAEQVEFCDFMLQQNDLHPDILAGATDYLLSQTNRESAGQAVRFYDRAVALLKQPKARYFGAQAANQYAQELAAGRASARKKYDGVAEPQLPALPPAWSEVRQLVDLAGANTGLARMFCPVVQGEFVYAAGCGTDPAAGGKFFQLMRIPLQGGALNVSSKISRPGVEARIACADAENYYLGTAHGVLVFPKTGGTVEVLDQNNALPSDEVTALDALDGKLYIGLGESGYLASYDLKQRQCQVLCSARRREHLSPFDNGLPLQVPIIVADESKHRIIFLANQKGGNPDWDDDLEAAKQRNADVFGVLCAKARAGMWSYLPADHEFKCILPRHPNADIYDLDMGSVRRASDSQIMMRSIWGQAMFDLTTDKVTLLYGKCYAIGGEDTMGGMVQGRGMILNPALRCLPKYENFSPGLVNLKSPSFLSGSWIWTTRRPRQKGVFPTKYTYSRIAMETGRVDDLPSLRLGDTNFNPEECFRRVGHDQALIGDQCGLWLVTLSGDDHKTQAAPH